MLPLKPEPLTAIRMQAIAPGLPETAARETAAETAEKIRETLSLAAAAAESKGTELSPGGLAAYASAIAPDWQGREGGGKQHRRRKEREEQPAGAAVAVPDGEESPEAGKTAAPPASGAEGESPDHFPAGSPQGLKKMFLETAENDPLLAVMNRLPGRNGKRWIVLPLRFAEGGADYKVSLRVLADENPMQSNGGRMALDIAESGNKNRRWLFMLESKGAAAPLAAAKMTVYVWPALPPKGARALARELSGIAGIPENSIAVREYAERFPCESGCANNLLHSVNEPV
jgi:hypothetical protein